MSSPGVFMLRERVILVPFVREVGLFSQPQLDSGSTRTLRARIRRVNKRIRRPGGEEVLVASEAIIESPSHEISEKDQITLPDGSIPPIVDVTSEPDHRGVTRTYKVLFGNSRRTG